MLANHPTTGGYPVVAVVDPDDLHLVAQARPGSDPPIHRRLERDEFRRDLSAPDSWVGGAWAGGRGGS